MPRSGAPSGAAWVLIATAGDYGTPTRASDDSGANTPRSRATNSTDGELPMNKDLLLFILIGILVLGAGAVLWFVVLAEADDPFVPADETVMQREEEPERGSAARREDVATPVGQPRVDDRPRPTATGGAGAEDETFTDGPAVLAGVITGPEGQPLAGALVTLFEDRSDIAASILQGDFLAQTESGADGAYRFEPPVQRNLMVRVDHLDWAMQSVGSVFLKHGQQRRIDFQLRPGLPLQGEVMDAGGNPLVGARVRVVDQSVRAMDPTTAVERELVTDAAGRFSFTTLTPGYKSVTASMEGYASAGRNGVIINQKRAPETIVLKLEEGHAIRGRVIDGNAQPIEGVLISAEPIRRGIENIANAVYQPVKTDDAGEFVYPGLRDGTYRLNANKFGYGAGRSTNARTGDEPVEIQLARNPVVRGRVVDAETGEPVTRFRVLLGREDTLVFASSQQTQYFESPTGEFEFENVSVKAPFYLFADAEGFAWSRSDLIPLPGIDASAAAEARAMEVGRRGEGGREAEAPRTPQRLPPVADVEGVEIRLERGARVRGRILDGDGKGIAGASVSLVPRPSSQSEEAQIFLTMIMRSMRTASLDARTDQNGEYLVENVQPGRFVVKASHRSFAAAETDVATQVSGKGEMRMPDLTLTKGGTITGTVVEKADRSAANAEVTVTPKGSGLTAGGGESYTATADAQGRFRVENVKPGIYQLRATAVDADPSSFLSNIFLNRQPTEIIIGDGETVEVMVD